MKFIAITYTSSETIYYQMNSLCGKIYQSFVTEVSESILILWFLKSDKQGTENRKLCFVLYLQAHMRNIYFSSSFIEKQRRTKARNKRKTCNTYYCHQFLPSEAHWQNSTCHCQHQSRTCHLKPFVLVYSLFLFKS